VDARIHEAGKTPHDLSVSDFDRTDLDHSRAERIETGRLGIRYDESGLIEMHDRCEREPGMDAVKLLSFRVCHYRDFG